MRVTGSRSRSCTFRAATAAAASSSLFPASSPMRDVVVMHVRASDARATATTGRRVRLSRAPLFALLARPAPAPAPALSRHDDVPHARLYDLRFLPARSATGFFSRARTSSGRTCAQTPRIYRQYVSFFTGRLIATCTS
jgi:hypothetical protein